MLESAHLKGANLYRANLKEAMLAFANLKGADFTDANVLRADLAGVNLEGCVGVARRPVR
jgi:uncharacterized protein YjbI with pentapeptide repeats